MARVYEITEEALRKFWPRASDAVIAGTLKAWPDVAAHYGFNTARRCAHFWGQITWECGGGTELRENLNYSAGRIVEVFGVGKHSAAVTAPEAAALAHHPYALGERVYGLGNPHMAKILGNTQPGDGYNFRGFGALNSTGREAAEKIGKAIGQDLVGNPDLCNDPGIALWAGAVEYVNSLGCFKFADRDDTAGETKRINGGLNALNDREALIAKWADYFAHADTTDAPDPAKPNTPAPSSPTAPARPPVIVSRPTVPAKPVIIPSVPAVNPDAGHVATGGIIVAAGAAANAGISGSSIPIAIGLALAIAALGFVIYSAVRGSKG